MEATPVESAIIRAVERHNLLGAVAAQRDRVEHFARRMVERELPPTEWVIVVLEVDDRHGRMFADLLMPGQDWEAVRVRDGGPPYARGIAHRESMQELLATGSDAAGELAALDGPGVLAVGRGIAAVYSVAEILAVPA